MQSIACGGLGGLHKQSLDAAQQAQPQRCARIGQRLQRRGLDAKSVSWYLHEAPVRRESAVQHRSRSHKSFAPDHANFNTHPVFHGSHNRADAAFEKIGAIRHPICFFQDSISGQIEGYKMWDEEPDDFSRQ
jgi:hypothetical protein